MFDASTFEDAGLDPMTVRITTGVGDDGFTVYGIQAGNVAARDLVSTVLNNSRLNPIRESARVIGGHDVVVLELQPYAADRAYLVPIGDTLVVIMSGSEQGAAAYIQQLP